MNEPTKELLERIKRVCERENINLRAWTAIEAEFKDWENQKNVIYQYKPVTQAYG